MGIQNDTFKTSCATSRVQHATSKNIDLFWSSEMYADFLFVWAQIQRIAEDKSKFNKNQIDPVAIAKRNCTVNILSSMFIYWYVLTM